MATYRSIQGTTYGSRTNTTINAPASVADGDELRMYFLLGAANQAAIPTPTFPAGWVVIGGPTTVNEANNSANFSVRSWTLRKRASSEGASYTITHSSSSSDGVIVAVQNAGTSGSVATNDGDGTGNITFNAVTANAVDSCIIAFCHNWDLWGGGTAPSGTTPTFTERQDSASSLIHVSTGNWTGSGSTGSPTKDSDNVVAGADSQWAAMLVCVENFQTAAVTGTATATIDEADVVAGGETIIVTLTNDTFVAATVGPNIQHVGSRVNSFAGTTSAQTVTLGSLTGGDTGDTTPQAGDLVIVTYAIGSTVARTPTIATPGGGAAYTDANAVLTQADNFDASMRVAYKFMGGTPDTQVTLSETGGGTGNIADAGAYTIQVFRGVDTSTPLDVAVVTGGAANSSAVDPGQITPSTAGAIVVAMGAAASGTGSTMTSSDLTDFVATSRADTNDISIGAGYSTWAAGALNPAAFGNIPAGTTANSWVSLTIALRPLVTTPFADARAAIIAGIDSAQAEAGGWDAKVKANIPVGNVVRTSDTVCTVTLQAQGDYDITAQETITVTVPASALTGGIAITATPTFTVDTDGGAPDPSTIIFLACDMRNIDDMGGTRG
jgi:hypothetical protein